MADIINFPDTVKRPWVQVYVPGKPVPKNTGKVSFIGGRPMVRDRAPVKQYRHLVSHETMLAMDGRPPFAGPVAITLRCLMPITDGWPDWKKEAAQIFAILPTTYPDIDNITKNIFDGIKDIAISDDRQIVELHFIKLYAPTAGIHITIQEVDAAPMNIKSKKAFNAWFGGEDV